VRVTTATSARSPVALATSSVAIAAVAVLAVAAGSKHAARRLP